MEQTAATTSTRCDSSTNKYKNMTREEFEKVFLLEKEKTRFELVYFILNTLNHLLNTDCYYCYCQRKGCCQICKIPNIFLNFERGIDKRMFNFNFLNQYYDRLTHELLKLFDQKQDVVECFQGEYVYSSRDWYTGEHWRVTLSESIPYCEKIHLNQMKETQLGPFAPYDLFCPDIKLSDSKG